MVYCQNIIVFSIYFFLTMLNWTRLLEHTEYISRDQIWMYPLFNPLFRFIEQFKLIYWLACSVSKWIFSRLCVIHFYYIKKKYLVLATYPPAKEMKNFQIPIIIVMNSQISEAKSSKETRQPGNVYQLDLYISY